MAITLDGSNGITTDIASNESATFNRDTTDGDLIILQKDNATVGAIGTQNGQTYLASPSAGIRFTTANMMPVNGSGTFTDDTLTIGADTERFKDLYLSGGVYLGGTGAANYLDDVEEGTWTPAPDTGTATVSIARYYKVGRQVTAWFNINNFSDTSSSNSVIVGGLPFTADTNHDDLAVGNCMIRRVNNLVDTVYLDSNSKLQFYKSEVGSFTSLKHNEINLGSQAVAYACFTYYTAS